MAGFACTGNGADHCCYLGKGGVCPHLEENTVDGRRWVCGLYRELGGWENVHMDDRWVTDVQPWLAEYGIADCGSWTPEPGICCRETEVSIDG